MDSFSTLSDRARTNFNRLPMSTAELLVLNKEKNQGPHSTYKPQPSSVLAQVKDFLPKLAASNEILKETVESGDGESVNIEHIDDSEGQIITMELALVEQGSDSEEDSDSSEESIQGEITEENIKLEPKRKKKPVIELLNNFQTNPDLGDDRSDGSYDVG